MTIETDSISEGGENRFKHLLPEGNLLQRSRVEAGPRDLFESNRLVPANIETLEIQPVDINVSLLNEAARTGDDMAGETRLAEKMVRR